MTRKAKPRIPSLVSIAALGSFCLLSGAFFFEYVMGLAPCPVCIWQRWPHVFAIAIGALFLAFPSQLLKVAGALAAATSGVLGVYHTGVERGWWEGPSTCSGANGDVTTLTPEQLLERILNAPVVRCTDVAWDFMGLSMASWNALFSFALVLVWLAALARR